MTDVKNKPTSEPDATVYRSQALRMIRNFFILYLSFTVLQVASPLIVGSLPGVRWWYAYGSMAINLLLLVLMGLYWLINASAEKWGWEPWRCFVLSTHSFGLISMVCWMFHIHFAGSSFTMLSMLIPFTALYMSWFLGTRVAWLYFLGGTAALIAMIGMENANILPFFPMFENARKIPLGNCESSRAGMS